MFIREAGWTSILTLMNSVHVVSWARGPPHLSHWPVPSPMRAPCGHSALYSHCWTHPPYDYSSCLSGGRRVVCREAGQGRQMVFTHDCAVWGLECTHMHWGGVFVCERERSFGWLLAWQNKVSLPELWSCILLLFTTSRNLSRSVRGYREVKTLVKWLELLAHNIYEPITKNVVYFIVAMYVAMRYEWQDRILWSFEP